MNEKLDRYALLTGLHYNNEISNDELKEQHKLYNEIQQAIEKAELYDNLMSANSEVVKNNISLSELQLKLEQANKVIDGIDKLWLNFDYRTSNDVTIFFKKLGEILSQYKEKE